MGLKSSAESICRSLEENYIGVAEVSAGINLQYLSLRNMPEQYSCEGISVGDYVGTPIQIMRESGDYLAECQEILPHSFAAMASTGLFADAYRKTDHWQSRREDVKKELVDKWFDIYFAADSINQKLG